VPAVKLVVPLLALAVLFGVLELAVVEVAEGIVEDVVCKPAVVLVVEVPLLQPASTKESRLNTQIAVVRRTVVPPLSIVAFVWAALRRPDRGIRPP
jgi:hypothetical protein